MAGRSQWCRDRQLRRWQGTRADSVPGYRSHTRGAGLDRVQRAHRPFDGEDAVATDDWADETFLIKYRLLSANEEAGDYIVTAFMGFSAPTAGHGNSSGHALFTPTLAAGKGFGDFDVQSTVGITFPNGGEDRLGWPLAWNTTFQYHVFEYFWPEFETNYTWYAQGTRTGQSQLFLTPGLLLGRFPIHDRVGVAFGGGYQAAVTRHPSYNNAVILSARITF